MSHPQTITLTRDDLLDLLTKAAQIGVPESAQTRGDITEYVSTLLRKQIDRLVAESQVRG